MSMENGDKEHAACVVGNMKQLQSAAELFGMRITGLAVSNEVFPYLIEHQSEDEILTAVQLSPMYPESMRYQVNRDRISMLRTFCKFRPTWPSEDRVLAFLNIDKDKLKAEQDEINERLQANNKPQGEGDGQV